MSKTIHLKNVLSILSAVICLLITMVTPVQAALDIEVTQAMDSTLPIAIAKFEWVGPGVPPTDIDKIVSSDLGRTGEFRVLDHNPNDPGYTPQSVNYQPWVASGVDHLVVGRIKAKDANNFQVEFSLLDVFQGNLHQKALNPILVQQTYTVTGGRMRGLAHHISDVVYEKLLGVKGAFSTRIAYITVNNRPGMPKRYRLEISDSDGYNPVTILDSPEPVMSPSWSPDGRKLAYVSFEHHRAEVYIADVISGARTRVSAKPGINGAPSWSPDGRSLAIVLSNENMPKVFILDISSMQLRQVTFGRSIDTEPNWHPSGKKLLFTSDRGGRPQIYELEVASGSVKRVTFDGDYNARAGYTPDGNSAVMIHRMNGDYHIAVQNLRNNQLTVLTQAQLDESPSLSPNGRMVIYGTIRNGRRVLGAVSIDGRIKLMLPATEGEVQEPAWSPFLS